MISYLTPGYPVALFEALAEHLGVELDLETGRSGPDPVDDPDAEDRPVQFSDVIVRADSEDQSLDDLAGRRIGCNDPASLSGCHALRIEATADEVRSIDDDVVEPVAQRRERNAASSCRPGELIVPA